MEEHKSRWYGGCAPGSRPVAIPVGAQVLWREPALWVCGGWDPAHVRTMELGDARIAVLGPCSASERDLARALSVPELATVARSWAGAHTVVRAGARGGAVEVLADAAESSPLYMVNAPGGLVWGSSALALSSLADGGADLEWLATYLRDKYAPARDRSAWSGVKPVPAGYMLMLGAGGTGLSPWWRPLRRTPEDASAALRHALSEGVRVRVEGVPVSADLAGMDSSTVTLLAAQYGPVTGVTVHPEGVTTGGDMEYARALNVPGLSRVYFPLGARHLPFSEAEAELPATDEPAPSAPVWAMLSDQLGAMAAAGSAAHLTGDGGDNLFLSAPTHLAGLARRGHWVRMYRDAMEWARLRRQSPLPLIAAAVRGDAAYAGRAAFPRPPWLAAEVPEPNTGSPDADTAFVASVRSVARSVRSELQLADSLGVALHNPYFDGAVLDAVVSAPIEQRYSARRYKPMLADTFADLLPDAHRKRAAKGLFVGDFHHGLLVNRHRWLTLSDGRLASLGLIDPAPLRAALHSASLGVESVWPPLLAAVSAETWLEAVERTPGTKWTNTAPAPADAR
ncbi:albusnodin/ikarugamycin family macrolactam cyclase [Streptomyces sp. NPDC004042]|uniref:albusnodin/ikarugamycin family macrolactam cyclase n=1 Tax=Streptomyces sp. NPDC004042 TaxID=3154451 RepID=UPI0033A0F9AE